MCRLGDWHCIAGLSPLVVEEITDVAERIQARARTPGGTVWCPDRGAATVRVHDYHRRTMADVAVDWRRVSVLVWTRRLVCPTYGCRRTFREQVPGRLPAPRGRRREQLRHVDMTFDCIDGIRLSGTLVALARRPNARPSWSTGVG